MVLLDVSIVNVALPSMQRDLGASAGGMQWVVSGYALTFGLVLVAGGRLGDALGRRRMFLFALTAFVLTSALAGFAPTEVLLILARLLQGMAGGLLTPQNTGLIQELFAGPERGRAFGMFGATVGLSTAVGPVLGGVILAAFGDPDGWRWVFFVNIPIGALALVLAAKLLPKSPRRLRGLKSELDFVGALLLGLAVAGVLFPVMEAEQGGLGSLWWMFPVAVVLGVLFVWWERRLVRLERAPLLDVRLFTTVRGFTSGATLGSVYFCAFTGIWLVFAMFFQQGLGYTPLESGLAVTPFAVGSAVSSVVAGRLVERWGRGLTVTGLTMVVVGMVGSGVAVLLFPAHAGLAVALPLLIGGLGGGMVISPNTTLTLECVPTRMAGVAGGALQTGQRIGTAIGTALLASIFHAVVTGSGEDYPVALAVSMGCAAALTAVALGLGIFELRRRRVAVNEEPSVFVDSPSG
ncbi:MFS transporter [Amycolatopsis sp. 195334CR]|nr:MFS transporter [Amycolatopsis sp. 195334CR]